MRGPADALLFGWGPLSYVKSFSYKPGPNVANNNLRVPLVAGGTMALLGM